MLLLDDRTCFLDPVNKHQSGLTLLPVIQLFEILDENETCLSACLHTKHNAWKQMRVALYLRLHDTCGTYDLYDNWSKYLERLNPTLRIRQKNWHRYFVVFESSDRFLLT